MELCVVKRGSFEYYYLAICCFLAVGGLAHLYVGKALHTPLRMNSCLCRGEIFIRNFFYSYAAAYVALYMDKLKEKVRE